MSKCGGGIADARTHRSTDACTYRSLLYLTAPVYKAWVQAAGKKCLPRSFLAMKCHLDTGASPGFVLLGRLELPHGHAVNPSCSVGSVRLSKKSLLRCGSLKHSVKAQHDRNDADPLLWLSGK